MRPAPGAFVVSQCSMDLLQPSLEVSLPDQIAPVRWEPDRAPAEVAWPMPDLSVAVWRGVRGLCPACGQAHAFNGYLSVVPECPSCHAPLGRFRADDAPPYFTILIVGHLVVGPMLAFPFIWRAPVALVLATTLPTLLVLTLLILPRVKGAVVGFHWAVDGREEDERQARPHRFGAAPTKPAP